MTNPSPGPADPLPQSPSPQSRTAQSPSPQSRTARVPFGREVLPAEDGLPDDDPPPRVPVLIAGGGPVGLAAATELNLHGIACAVLEPRQEVTWLRPRAKTVSARTMEHFRRWGLANTIRERAPLPVSWSQDIVFCTTLTGREITRFHDAFGLGLAGGGLVAEPGQQAPQPLIEEVLREAVREAHYPSLFPGWRVTGLAQDGEEVRVAAEDANGRRATIAAEYVIGCDGARSVVREAIGARFEGNSGGKRSVNVTFRAPGLAHLVPHGPAVQYWVLNPAQGGLIGRLDLADTWWCIANGVGQTAGEAHAAAIVHAMTGTDLPIEVLATDAWTARMQLADRYGRGRVFIAGDAAHQNPPYGGHGFNTGIGDAVNLGWKLAAVLNRWAPTALLDTYHSERRPVGAETIAEASRNMSTLAPELADPRLMGTDEEFAAVLPSVREAVQRTKHREFHSLDLVLGYAYPDSPLTVNGAGERLPHRWIGPGDSLYDHLGNGLTLIRCDYPGYGAADGGLVAVARALAIPLTVLDLTGDGWAEHFGAGMVLVRPDQHVSWLGDRIDDALKLLRAAVGW
ncbi:MAG TPA: FAD-dependent monooxygenase [Streptosporangiaceae bacterium]|nr:FAD-dependent monooxygenase [Streptosporangiaceae bacterium]